MASAQAGGTGLICAPGIPMAPISDMLLRMRDDPSQFLLKHRVTDPTPIAPTLDSSRPPAWQPPPQAIAASRIEDQP